eukprot:s1288_g7.t1
MGRLRTVFCRSGREVCMHVDEENTTVRELRSQVLSTLGRVEANAKQAVSGCAGMMCLVSNEHVADLLGLTADVLHVEPSSATELTKSSGLGLKRVMDDQLLPATPPRRGQASDAALGKVRQWTPLVMEERQPLASVQEGEVADNLGVDGETPSHSDEPGFRNILRRASAPAILESSGQIAAPSNPAQKKADAIQLWWAERQRLGYDAYNGDESPSPSPELPVRRPRSMSLSAEMRGDEGDADDGLVEVPTDLPSGRRRSRANFSAADIEERARFPGEEGTAVDSAASFPPEGDFQMDEISRNDAPNLLQDFNLQVMPKPKPVVQSVDEFLAADPPLSLAEFLAPDDERSDQADKRRCWTADVSEMRS